VSAADPARARPVLEPYAGARFRFGGPMGERIEANFRHWLLPALALKRWPAMSSFHVCTTSVGDCV
jgi:hypothetical protein